VASLSSTARRTVGAVRRRATNVFWRNLPGIDREAFELRPFQLALEFTNLCNANCVFCPYSQQLRPHHMMSERVFKKAVSEFVAMGGGSIDLTPPVGDALIHPKFLEWVRHLRSFPGIDRILLTTNGILLDRHGIEDVLDAGLSRINISLAGFDEEMYRRVYRSPAYKKMRANVTKLLEINSRRTDPVPIVLCFRADRPSASVTADPDLQPLLAYNPTLQFLEIFSRSGGLNTAAPPGIKLAPVETRPKRQPCRRTYLGLLVQSNGDVQACGCESSVNAPAMIVGNIEAETLLDIWRGKRMQALRESFKNDSLNPNCASCDYYYAPPDFHTRHMRMLAKTARRRMAGEVIRHTEPSPNNWALD
jgi:radical SAM protein with 4Fe4S-binding SPASM domain